MKSKVFKFILPAFALLLAVGFAFAAEDNYVSQTAYYNHPILGVQSVIIGDECQPSGAISCEFNGHQLYQEASLTTPLRKN
ncbi:DUF6520 family protein [Seonamhaeicola maritimus]|uniref:Secreted protein n=1 Tax=Seonamhaeicola maritimus TaxID=2591822 RepID=A0A5C7GMU9_9FLAO|nr:DUF6520 family protein [Seonamhaeicola maritimus]TXG39574.1 hypothetical protein FUA22_06825 [Seonamhaeicola maritimus]